ncbi:MAG TPA: hypothetical protein VKU00_06275 [Chthonomonadaceae bacterium]|nr:hypothetical protein [Chthonomonadaceae bacterium]
MTPEERKPEASPERGSRLRPLRIGPGVIRWAGLGVVLSALGLLLLTLLARSPWLFLLYPLLIGTLLLSLGALALALLNRI